MDTFQGNPSGQSKAPASQHEALLEVTESIAAHRDLAALFHDLKERLPRLVNFDTLWLVLHEPSRSVMRVHLLETPSRVYVDFVERPIEEAPAGSGRGKNPSSSLIWSGKPDSKRRRSRCARLVSDPFVFCR